jgi:hypothetical protein
MKFGFRAVLVMFLLLVGACSSPAYLEDLKTPALLWQRARGLCGSWLAVDADGTLWREDGGCENGRPALKSKGRSEVTKVEALRRAFESLPTNAGPDRLACGGNLHTFSSRTSAATIETRACGSGNGYDDLTGLQGPYLEAAMRFLALP